MRPRAVRATLDDTTLNNMLARSTNEPVRCHGITLTSAAGFATASEHNESITPRASDTSASTKTSTSPRATTAPCQQAWGLPAHPAGTESMRTTRAPAARAR
ncbi:MAG: hypothetical protein ACO3YQ_04750, partial [Flavobacteriales bacterium]